MVGIVLIDVLWDLSFSYFEVVDRGNYLCSAFLISVFESLFTSVNLKLMNNCVRCFVCRRCSTLFVEFFQIVALSRHTDLL